MKYYIEVEEIRSTVIEVEADNSEQAIQKVEAAYDKDIVCLNDVDYIDDGTQFYDETDKWEKAVKAGLTDFQSIN